MHVIIFEGMATSGKSTLIKLLQEKFQGSLKIVTFTEEQTHEPIMNDMSNANVPFFKSLLTDIAKDSDLVIFDRLYLTQAFRANTDLKEYAEIESGLAAYRTVTVFLKVDESAIAKRVMKAAEHRRTSWGDYIKTKGKTPNEVADYYIKQQQSQLKILETSTLPYKVFDTTNHDYQKIANEIQKIINQ